MIFNSLNELLEKPIYSLSQAEKSPLFLKAIEEVTTFHFNNCAPYRTLCTKRNFAPENMRAIEDLPYLPTSLFKDALLLSVPEDKVFREITSSATTSGRSSRMGLDKETSRRQSKCFSKSVIDRLGTERYKFIVLDEPSSVARSAVVSARSSTIKSLLFCSREVHTCIVVQSGQLILEEEKLLALLEEAERNNETVVIFGFTFILYHYVVQQLLKSGRKFNLPGSKIVHIGGWKKLESQKVTPAKLMDDCREVFGVAQGNVIDIYGFTEQSGLIYPSCEEGYRHTPEWCEIIIRDPLTLKRLPNGQAGLMQFITPIQTSYPGHSVLTEDVGNVVNVDNCECGRKGTTFMMTGRAPNAEVRGCGDIMADKFA